MTKQDLKTKLAAAKAKVDATKTAKRAEPKKVKGARKASATTEKLLSKFRSKDGLTRKDIIDITGLAQPPQTQIVARLCRHAGIAKPKTKTVDGVLHYMAA